jgi:hypothetical protein
MSFTKEFSWSVSDTDNQEAATNKADSNSCYKDEEAEDIDEIDIGIKKL